MKILSRSILIGICLVYAGCKSPVDQGTSNSADRQPSLHSVDDEQPATVFETADVPPQIDLADQSLMQYLRQQAQNSEIGNFILSERASRCICFIVTAKGGLCCFNTCSEAKPSILDEWVFESLQKGPGWSPATIDGQAVAYRVYFKYHF